MTQNGRTRTVRPFASLAIASFALAAAPQAARLTLLKLKTQAEL
jgi:hypothetical protein